jgi:hypothetical protein
MKEKLYKTGFQVRPKGAKDAWARVTKEIEMFKGIIEQTASKSSNHQKALTKVGVPGHC